MAKTVGRTPCARCGMQTLPGDLFRRGGVNLQFDYGCFACSPMQPRKKSERASPEVYALSVLAYCRAHPYGAETLATTTTADVLDTRPGRYLRFTRR